MKNIALLALTVVMILGIMPNCKKKKGDSACTGLPAISVITSPALNTVEAPSPGPTFPLSVTLSSPMPAGGITITVKARPEASGTPFYTETKTSTTANTDFIITNTPTNVPSIVEITVSAKNCSSNTFSGSYRYSKK